jgi:L-arabinose isomerase
MSVTPELRVGLCGIGLEAYWEQFDGLRDQLEGYVAHVASELRQPGVELITLDLVDSPTRARNVGRDCRAANIDLLLLYVTTYALSSTVLLLAQQANIPILVLNLQPTSAIDYEAVNRLSDRTRMTGAWLAYCSACPVPEIANLFVRAGLPFHQVTGYLDELETWQQIREWLAAARVRSVLRAMNLGLLGHYYSGMLDVATDITQIAITFGCHLEMLEVDELTALRESVAPGAIAERVAHLHTQFDVQPDCPPAELDRAARTSIALDRFVSTHELGALAYYYKGAGNAANEDTMSSIILGTSLLTANHIPVAGEYEVKNAIAMKILDTLGAGGSFTEYYAIDFADDIVLMGHDGPGHTAIAQGRTKVRPLDVYHGKVGRGLSVEMSVRLGPVTLLSIAEERCGSYKLLVAHATCESGETLAMGNTNSRFRFPLDARSFVERWNDQGPAHHCAIGIGHLGPVLQKLARLLEIPIHQVC